MNPLIVAGIATIISEAIKLARANGVDPQDLKAELVRLRAESQTAHDNLDAAIIDALREGEQ
jgi:3-hydroxyisobutyrate dehydrogenase-like beta-hydroxyacid dehydrogenase